MTTHRIVVVGSCNTDLVVRASRLPRPGETVMGRDLLTTLGGKGANQAVAAARQGAAVMFVARVGRDNFGDRALEQFRREGMDTRHVTRDDEAPSGVALIVVEPGGQNIIAVAPGANARLSPADVEAARPAIREARVLMVQLEVPFETVLAAARAGREAGAIVQLNPAPAPPEPLPESIFPTIDLITPNESEAERLTGQSSPEAAARELLRRGVKTVIVTLGKAGAMVATERDGTRVVPGFQVVAVDATAAGDAFNGGLAEALARGETLEAAVRRAHAVAAISVTREGALPSLPTAVEVETFLRSA